MRPYRNPNLPVEERVKDLLRLMSVEEKIAQLRSEADSGTVERALGTTGFGFYAVYPLRGHDPAALATRLNELQKISQRSRLGIPVMPYEEALHGLIDRGHTSFPQAIGLAATWDPDFVHEVAQAIADETAAEGIHQVLSPVINVCRDARWGRVEESYGEDPFLQSKVGVAFVTAFEKSGIATTPKHFIANLWDGGRDSHSVQISMRQLFDVYMPPFEAVIREGGARSLMCSYNAVNGVPCASDPWLLTDVLRKQLGFKGYVVSDWGAAGNVLDRFHMAADEEHAAALLLNAGMDSEAPGIYLFGKPLEDAVKHGLISQKTLDESVARVLRVKFEKGLFDKPFVDPAKAAAVANSPAHRALALEASRRAMVLLKNDRNVLPLAKTGRIAVFGDLANGPVPLGGYSGDPGTRTSILAGLKSQAPGVEVDYVSGCAVNPTGALPSIPARAFGNGLKAEFWKNPDLSGAPALTRTDRNIDFDWGDGAPAPNFPNQNFSARWTGTLTAAESGEYELGATSDDGVRVWVDDRLVIEDWSEHAPELATGRVRLTAGKPARIKVEFFQKGGGAVLKLGWRRMAEPNALMSRVREAASAADASIVFAGIREGEGQDRAYLKLPGNQEDVIKAAAEAGKPVVVVLVAGAPVTMEGWYDGVPAILDAWYPGQEGPAAIAEVLFGDANPGGKLPMTFPRTVGQCPIYYNLEASGRGYDYVDSPGSPLFPFGHGLSYTTFGYSNLRISPSGNGSYRVTCDVQNTGRRAGDEVVQLYIHQQVASALRPLRELKGFQRVSLRAGERKTVTFSLGFAELSMYDAKMKRVVEPGKFDIMVGSSAADIRLSSVLAVGR